MNSQQRFYDIGNVLQQNILILNCGIIQTSTSNQFFPDVNFYQDCAITQMVISFQTHK